MSVAGNSCSLTTLPEGEAVEEFVDAARCLKHPFDDSSTLGDDLLVAAFDLLTKGPDEIRASRKASFEHGNTKEVVEDYLVVYVLTDLDEGERKGEPSLPHLAGSIIYEFM